MSSVMEISEILDRINRVTGRFEREAVEAAIVRQDEITPELLQILEKLLRALEALEQLVRSGRVERAVVVLYFRELFNGKLERTRSDLLGLPRRPCSSTGGRRAPARNPAGVRTWPSLT